VCHPFFAACLLRVCSLTYSLTYILSSGSFSPVESTLTYHPRLVLYHHLLHFL
jgi:hypothetical protein